MIIKKKSFTDKRIRKFYDNESYTLIILMANKLLELLKVIVSKMIIKNREISLHTYFVSIGVDSKSCQDLRI